LNLEKQGISAMSVTDQPIITEHDIHIVFPFFFSITPKNQAIVDKQYIKIRDHTKLDCLLDLLPYNLRQKKLLHNKKNEAVWKKSKLTLDLKLDTAVKNTLDDSFCFETNKIFKKAVPHGYPSLVLSQATLDVLNHESRGIMQGLDVKLSKSACKRLSNNGDACPDNLPWVNFIIKEVRLFMLGTGVGGVSIKVSMKNISSTHYLQETLYQLSRNNISNKKVNPVRWHSNSNESESESFRFIDIISSILPFLQDPIAKKQSSLFKIDSSYWDKAFCYTAIKLDKPFNTTSQKEDFIVKISKKFTDAYLPRNAIMESSIYKPFDYISHAVSLEGGSILIEPSSPSCESPHALDAFIKNNVKSCYYPITLMAYFEYIALLRLSENGMKKINFHHPSAHDLMHLNTFKSNVYNFRLNYRFSHISNNTMHNAIYKKWRESLLSKDILEDISNDASDVTNFVDSIRKDKIASELKIIEKIIVYFGGISLIKEMTGFNIYEKVLKSDFIKISENAQSFAPISLFTLLSLFVLLRILLKK